MSAAAQQQQGPLDAEEARPRKRARRACPRRRATSDTSQRVTSDVWMIVCRNAFFSPHTVFRLMMACKELWLALRAPESREWWDRFLARIVAYQQCLSHSNYLPLLRACQKQVRCSRGVIRLVYSPRCFACGSRFGRTIFMPMLQRVCSGCLSAQLVSNKVLDRQYGLSFSDFILPYKDAGGLIIARQSYCHRRAELLRLSKVPPLRCTGHSAVG